MRKFTGKIAAGLLAAIVAVAGMPVSNVPAALNQPNQIKSVVINKEKSSETAPLIKEGDYTVPISLKHDAIPMQPVKDAFASALGENGKLHVDADGNMTLSVNCKQMNIDFGTMVPGGSSFKANLKKIYYYDAEGNKQPATVESTRTGECTLANGYTSEKDRVEKTSTVPDEISFPLISDTTGTYKINYTCDFMNFLMGDSNLVMNQLTKEQLEAINIDDLKEYIPSDAVLTVDLSSLPQDTAKVLSRDVNEAKTYKGNKYTVESFDKLQSAIQKAETALEDPDAEDALTEAQTELKAAVEGLKLLAENTWIYGQGKARRELTPGTYSVPVKLQKGTADMEADNYFADSSTSMAGTCINGPASVVVHKDGSATMTVKLQAVSVMQSSGWASSWNIYQSFEAYINTSEKDNLDKKAARIDAAATNEGKEQVTKISFKIPDTDRNAVFTQMYIDIMKTNQNAAFAIGWDSIKKTSDTSSDTSDVEAEYKEMKDKVSSAVKEIEKYKEADYTQASYKTLKAAAETAQKAVENNAPISELQTAFDDLQKAESGLIKAEKKDPVPAVVKVGVPSSVKAAGAAYNAAKISWNKVAGATAYEVYQYNSKTKKYVKTADVKGTSYAKKGLTCGTTYSFKVRAYKKADGKTYYSAFSKTVSAKPALSQVKSLKVKNVKKRSAKLSWKKVSGASGYKIYRATKRNGKYKAVKTVTKGTTVKYTNKKLKKSKKYYYKVRAYKKAGKKTVYGSYSSKANVKIKK